MHAQNSDVKLPASSRVTLATYSYPNKGLELVLGDWIEFMGTPVPNILLTSPAVFSDDAKWRKLTTKFPTLEVIFVGEKNQNPEQYDSLGIITALENVSTDYILFVKMDTLPFRRGNDNWLKESLETMEANDAFAFTGSERWPDTRPIDTRYAMTRRISVNFALCNPREYLDVLIQSKPPFVSRVRQGKVSFEERFLMESIVEEWLSTTGRFNVVRDEDIDWSVFHVHQREDELLNTREKYRRREGIAPFLNRTLISDQEPWQRHPWNRYFGYPKPSALRRARIALGALQRQMFAF